MGKGRIPEEHPLYGSFVVPRSRNSRVFFRASGQPMRTFLLTRHERGQERVLAKIITEFPVDHHLAEEGTAIVHALEAKDARSLARLHSVVTEQLRKSGANALQTTPREPHDEKFFARRGYKPEEPESIIWIKRLRR